MIILLLKSFEKDKSQFDYCYPAVKYVILPVGWWLKDSTNNYQTSTHLLRLIQFNKNLPIKKLSNPNTLEAAQVDYLIKEKYKCTSEISKRKWKFIKYCIHLSILITGWIVLYLLTFLIR